MATPVLIFINVVIFLLTGFSPPGKSVFPHLTLGAEILDRGECVSALVWSGEIWRLLTATFLHANLLHLLLNMYGLHLLGSVLEREIGTWRFLVVYFATGIFGFMVSLIFLDYRIPTLGASGAIFGLMGGLIGYGMSRSRNALEFLEQDLGRSLLMLAVVNIALGFGFPRINNAAHIGGLLMGLVLTQIGLVSYHRRPDRNGWLLRAAAAILCVEAALYGFSPIFNGGWHFYRAVSAAEQGRPHQSLPALARALRLEPELRSRPEVQDLGNWLRQHAGSPLGEE